MSLRGDAGEFNASAAAQRRDDHDFVVCTQDMVEASSHVAIDEKADVRANAMLFIDNAVAHAWVAPIKNVEQSCQGFPFGLDLTLTAGIGKKRARNEDANHATVME
jgi:hypothetical protein